MPTSYTLGKHFKSFVQAQLASGRYNNASEALRDALRLMEDRERKLARSTPPSSTAWPISMPAGSRTRIPSSTGCRRNTPGWPKSAGSSEVVFSKAAETDLESIGDHIAKDNARRALTFVRELQAKAQDIGRLPRAFPLVPRYEHHGIRRRPTATT